MRIWSIYNVGMGRFGDLSLSGLWRVDSGTTFSLAARNQPLTATQRAIIAAAGYPDVQSSSDNHVFFAERGSETFKGYGLLDTSINYEIPVFRSVRPWLKFDVYNLLNNQKLVAWNTTVTQDPNSPRDELGLATNFVRGSAFGTATGNAVTNLNLTAIPAFPQWAGGFNGGRTLRFAAGIRF
jgi:hypothetical protein